MEITRLANALPYEAPKHHGIDGLVAGRVPSRVQSLLAPVGVPLLAWGMGHGAESLTSAGGWCLLGGVVTGGTSTALVLRHAFVARRQRAPGSA